ncbi:hypothetical protein ACIQU5_07685 [Streptomyces sp. NPDC090306]|uniref:hypothetical protein n=1 Tax=unclassified Streptomyces TaxID=2593676 RepID=UPI0036ECF0A8
MTERDIGLLLADAADGFDSGPAPVQAVVRAGRARRTRRRAAVGAVGLAAAALAGTLAVAGLPGGEHAAQPAKPSAPDTRSVTDPQISEVGFGTYAGKGWAVKVQVWSAPRDRAEAARQLKAMDEWGLTPSMTGGLSDLVGRTSYFVVRAYGPSVQELVTFGTAAELPGPKGNGIDVVPQPLGKKGDPLRLVVGSVAKTVKQVACHWKDGSTTLADLAPENSSLQNVEGVIRSVHGYPTANWFACVAPGATTYKSAEVTK